MPFPISVKVNVPPALKRLISGASGGFSGGIGGNINTFGAPGGPKLTFTARKYVGKTYSTQGAGTSGELSGGGSQSPGAGAGTVQLILPEEFSVSYGAQYEEFAMGAVLTSIANGELGDASSAAFAAAQQNIMGMAGSFVGLEGANEAFLQQKGVAKNPNTEMLFRNMNFRTFTFNFKFHASNPSESQRIKNIVDTFKVAMHPTIDGPYLNYPDTFKIEYSSDVGGDSFYHKFATSVLTDMTYNYSGTGVTAQFKDGAPVETSLSLTFKEIEFLTKESVQAGM